MRQFYPIVLFLILLSCASVPYAPYKINGVSFVAAPNAIDSSHVKPLVDIKANAASVMPFGFIRDLNHPDIIYNTDRQWFGESKAGAKQYIEKLHEANISVMLKPQIWIWHGEFTGNLVMTSEKDWQILETSYSKFIIDFAKVAQETNVDIFCIGTELELFIKNRPTYWKDLIKNIKTIYKGELTYAANWDEFWRTPFWSELDYIGIDAYFPVSDKKTPSVEDCIKGWKKHKEGLKTFSKELGKSVLFTEYGYRSVDYTGKEPWRYDRSMTSINLEAQNNATQALFKSVWEEDWFSGGYLWKWFVEHEKVGGLDNNQFTPQNKPVEQIIKMHYSQY